MRSVFLRGLVLVAVLTGLMTGVPHPASGQSIVERYQAERLRYLSAEWMKQTKPVLPPKPLVRLAAATDSLRPAPADSSSEADAREPAFTIDHRKTIGRLARSTFKSRFGDTKWAFLGAGYSVTVFDTTRTLELRARMEAHFGAPSQTLADFPAAERPDDPAQFEYWFVVNDSIPVMVSDAGGPFDRGLILATDARYRDDLRALRQALLAPLRESQDRAPYVDYYYHAIEEAWYRTGFDGREFFVEPIRAREVIPGRRPWIPSDSIGRRVRRDRE